MEYVSTSALATELGLKSSDLFDKLKSIGWIERNGEKWCLTELGKQKGGQTRTNPNYGEFVVWPENLSLDTKPINDGRNLLSSTAIGEHFNISSQRVNLILSELGWIEKNVSGWKLTTLGGVFSGRQFEHDASGKKYVLWPAEILINKHLLGVLNETTQKPKVTPKAQNADKSNESAHPTSPIYIDPFRAKYPPTHKTLDGHIVRSKSEQLIDNFLYHHGIVHAYERKLPTEEDCYCDFYIPSGNGRPQAVYIEYWGIENNEKYSDRKKHKLEIYQRNGFALIELFDEEIQNLEEVLTRKLIKHNIKIG